MSSFFHSGSVRMNPEIKNEKFDSMNAEEYPHEIPKVYLDGCGEEYYPQQTFNWKDDSVFVIRDKRVMKYTRSSFYELLAKNEEGEVVWLDGRNAPYSSCWSGEYLDEFRPAYEYTLTEFDLETYKKKKYKVVLEEEQGIGCYDYDFYALSKMVEKELLGIHVKIENGVLLEYVGADEEVVIPEGVKEISSGALLSDFHHNSIKIPKTVEEISFVNFWLCHFKNVEIAADNPRYISKDGFVIDKKTKTLMWAHTGNVIPNDGSVRKIAANAFGGRTDIEEIEIPDSILEIDTNAFSNCFNIKYVKIPDSFKEDGERLFGAPLVKDGDKYRIDRGIKASISSCTKFSF